MKRLMLTILAALVLAASPAFAQPDAGPCSTPSECDALKPAAAVGPKLTPAPMPVAAAPVAKPAPATVPMAAVAPTRARAPAAMLAPVPRPLSVTVKQPPQKMGAGEIARLVLEVALAIIMVVMTILGRKGLLAWTKKERWSRLLHYADLAYPAVEGLVKKTPNIVDDKLLAFFGEILKMLKAAGETPLTEAEKIGLAEVAAKKALADTAATAPGEGS